MTEKILCVDDDPNILAAYTRQLRKQFALETAEGAQPGLEALSARGPFAVVVTDMRMPGLSGVEFLRRVRDLAPLTVRMMLTGNADQQTAIDAVNQGSIFRFLTKPCQPETFANALRAALDQYRLVTAEKELLEQTLRGSIKVLTEVLSLVNPVAFGRAARVQRLVQKLAAAFAVDNAWELEVAAMLSQLGCVTVPETVLGRVYAGADVPASEMQMFERHPQIGHDLIARIPRLESVAQLVAYQDKRYDGVGPPQGGKSGDAIPLGARILKCALDYDVLQARGHTGTAATDVLKRRAGWYDSRVLEVLEHTARQEMSRARKQVLIVDLCRGMILAEDLVNTRGVILVAKGQEISDTLLNRLQNILRNVQIREPIAVLAADPS
jgi:response regulator RpfG family c-di-GMP phosphodiesterase